MPRPSIYDTVHSGPRRLFLDSFVAYPCHDQPKLEEQRVESGKFSAMLLWIEENPRYLAMWGGDVNASAE
jgi:hypothetical protein